jgi:hypothetical protein
MRFATPASRAQAAASGWNRARYPERVTVQPTLDVITMPRFVLQTIAENLRCDQGRLDTGPQRINHFATAARRQVMLMGASKTTMTQAVGRRAAVPSERPSLVAAAAPGVLLPVQRSHPFYLDAATR